MVRLTPTTRILSGALVLGALLTNTSAQQATTTQNSWPRWRGPTGNDHSPDKGLLKKWPDAGPTRIWLFEKAGKGYSGFSVVGNRIYTMGSRGGACFTFCLDFATGKEVWASKVGSLLKNGWGDGPRATPTVDGDRIYTMTGPGEVVCLNRADGKEVWRQNMQEFGAGKVPTWGYSESLTVDDGRVICTPNGGDAGLLALDKKNGKKLWQCQDLAGKADYSSVVTATIHGKKQYIRLFQKKVGGVDAKTGKLIWSAPWPGRTAVCPTPIVKDNRVYVTSGYGVGCMMVEVEDDDSAEIVWQNKVMRNHHGGVILVGDYLYGHADYAWVCQKWSDGEEVWRNRSLRKGGVHYADGMLYCVEEGSGVVALVRASPQGFQEASRFELEPQSEIRSRRGKIWTHPVVLDGKMLLRDQEYIYCYDVRGKADK